MRNSDIIQLGNSGIVSITSFALDSKAAYRVVRFKQAINHAMRAIYKQECALQAECGIRDIADFYNKMQSLKQNDAFSEAYKEMEAKFLRYNDMVRAYYEEDTPIEARTISFEDFRKLQEENKQSAALTGMNELLLEGILWDAPDEEKED